MRRHRLMAGRVKSQLSRLRGFVDRTGVQTTFAFWCLGLQARVYPSIACCKKNSLLFIYKFSNLFTYYVDCSFAFMRDEGDRDHSDFSLLLPLSTLDITPLKCSLRDHARLI